MNFSKTICLPKQALKNLGVIEGDSLKVELVQDEDEKFLKLTPVIEVWIQYRQKQNHEGKKVLRKKPIPSY